MCHFEGITTSLSHNRIKRTISFSQIIEKEVEIKEMVRGEDR